MQKNVYKYKNMSTCNERKRKKKNSDEITRSIVWKCRFLHFSIFFFRAFKTDSLKQIFLLNANIAKLVVRAINI